MYINITVLRQRVNHPYQMIFRDPVSAANLLCRDNSVRVRTKINKDSQSVISV